MTWSILWAAPAVKDLQRLDAETARRVKAGIERLATTGHGDVKRLQGRRRSGGCVSGIGGSSSGSITKPASSTCFAYAIGATPTAPDEHVNFDRITFDPAIMGGRACIRGMRVPVSVLVGQIAHGASFREILDEYPDLEREDLRQALAYAASLAQE